MARFTITLPIANARDDVGGDPADNNSDNAETGLLCNDSCRWREIEEMVKLYTVKDGVADTDVCEVHAERLFPFKVGCVCCIDYLSFCFAPDLISDLRIRSRACVCKITCGGSFSLRRSAHLHVLCLP